MSGEGSGDPLDYARRALHAGAERVLRAAPAFPLRPRFVGLWLRTRDRALLGLLLELVFDRADEKGTRRRLEPLRSVAPSTTAAALTSITTGLAPRRKTCPISSTPPISCPLRW